MWLLINNSVHMTTAPFGERYKLFEDPNLAHKAAESLGLYDNFIGTFAHPSTMSAGLMQRYCYGPLDISLMRLEITK